MKRISIFLILFLTSCLANSQVCTTWGCKTTIDSLYTNVSGLIYVSTAGDETKANCTVYPGNYFVLDPTKSNADKVYASMLAAKMANKEITLRIKEGSPNCELAYVNISN